MAVPVEGPAIISSFRLLSGFPFVSFAFQLLSACVVPNSDKQCQAVAIDPID